MMIVVLSAIALIPVKASIHFTKSPEELNSSYKITVAGITVLSSDKKQKKRISKKSNTEAEKSVSNRNIKITDVIRIYNDNSDDILSIIGYASQNAVRFDNIEINLLFGTGNAAATGISYGAISGIIYSLLGVIDSKCGIEHYKVDIHPDFYTSVFETDCRCIVKLKNVHIIVIAIKLLILMFKIRKTMPDRNIEENTTLAKEGKECD